MAYADDVTVLRRGRLVMSVRGGGHRRRRRWPRRWSASARPHAIRCAWQRLPNGIGTPVRCRSSGCRCDGDRGEPARARLEPRGARGRDRRRGRRVGQRPARTDASRWSGSACARAVRCVSMGEPYRATRSQNRQHAVRSLPEEPLRNACVGELSVASNMALAQLRPAAAVALGLDALGRGSRRSGPRADRRVRRQDAGREGGDPHAVGRQRAARGAGARAVERGAAAAGRPTRCSGSTSPPSPRSTPA